MNDNDSNFCVVWYSVPFYKKSLFSGFMQWKTHDFYRSQDVEVLQATREHMRILAHRKVGVDIWDCGINTLARH